MSSSERAHLSPHLRRLIADWPTGHVATVTPDGHPRVAPEETVLVLGDRHLAFGAIREDGTLADLRQRPEVEIGFLDPVTRKGARVRGTAECLRPGDDDFPALFDRFLALWPDLAPRIGTVVRITVTEAAAVASPLYEAGAAEDEIVAQSLAHFRSLHP